MESPPLLIHTHFHNRRTGVTRSIENIFPFFQNKYEIYILGSSIKGRRISYIKMLSIVMQKKYFIMHCHRNNEIFIALLFRILGGNFKLIVTRHSETLPSFITKYLIKKSDVVIALTKSMAQKLPKPAHIIEHGIDIDYFKPDNQVLQQEITQKNIIACIGRIREAKGQKVLFKAIAPVLKKYPEWALAIVGKVDNPFFYRDLKLIIDQHSIKNQVYFIKETSDILSFYQASHSVIIPSFTEGFSLVCAEAMSCGCNVIATNGVGIHSKIIKDGKTGYLFEVADISGLQELIIKLFEGELPHLGENARNEIVENWSSENEAKKLIELYNSYF